MIKLFTIITALLLATNAQAEPVADLVIQGEIGSNMRAASEAVLKLTAAKQDTINILIDSPGGSVYAGWNFINVLKQAQASGVTVNCYVSGMAASMAFQILSFCDGRYTLPYSMLLWHPVRAGSRSGFTPREARHLARHLREVVQQLISELRSNFSISDKFFWHHYRQETLHLAKMLEGEIGGLEFVDSVPTITKDTAIAREIGFSFSINSLKYMHPQAVKVYYGRDYVQKR